MRAVEHPQLDPLNITARSQDLMLHARVSDYTLESRHRLRGGIGVWVGRATVELVTPVVSAISYRRARTREREENNRFACSWPRVFF